MTFRKTRLQITSFGDARKYVGYVNDEEGHWNGWAKPYFSKSTALKILRDMERDKIGARGWASGQNHGIQVYEGEWNGSHFTPQESYLMEPVEIQVGGHDAMLVYPLGNGSWTWQEVDC